MEVRNLINTITEHFHAHGVAVLLTLVDYIEKFNRYIFRVTPQAGTRIKMIFSRADDIGTALGLPLFVPFPEGQQIFLAVSNQPATENRLVNMLFSPLFRYSTMQLPIALGYDLRGQMVFSDLAQMPHALYGGASNSGKSVGLMCLILSLICKNRAQTVNLILIDAGGNSLSPFMDIPHLSYPIVKDSETSVYVLNELVNELDRRLSLTPEELAYLPAIVCVIDECASLTTCIVDSDMSSKLRIALSTILQRGRHAKIHLVLSAQNPTAENLNRIDIANVRARMAFSCAKYHNSIAILGQSGAEKLTGNGAMLFKSPDKQDITRLQGAFVSDKEADAIVSRICFSEHDLSRKFEIPPVAFSNSFSIPSTNIQTERTQGTAANVNGNELCQIILWVLERKTVSANQLIEHFKMGNRAYDIMDRLSEMGLVSKQIAKQPRTVLANRFEEIPPAVMDCLMDGGISEDKISEALQEKNDRCSDDFCGSLPE